MWSLITASLLSSCSRMGNKSRVCVSTFTYLFIHRWIIRLFLPDAAFKKLVCNVYSKSHKFLSVQLRV